jgi:hypothetical protein
MMLTSPQQPAYNTYQPSGYSAHINNNTYNGGYTANYYPYQQQRLCGGCTCCAKAFMCDRGDNYEYKIRSIRYLSLNTILFILPCIIFIVVGTQLCAKDMVPCCLDSGEDTCKSDGSGTQVDYYGPCGGEGATADDDFGFCASYCSTVSDISYFSSAYCLKEYSTYSSSNGDGIISKTCVAADSCCGNFTAYSLITTGSIVLAFVGLLCFSLLIVLSRNWHAKEGDIGTSVNSISANAVSPSSMPATVDVPSSTAVPYPQYTPYPANDNRFASSSSASTSVYVPSYDDYPS